MEVQVAVAAAASAGTIYDDAHVADALLQDESMAHYSATSSNPPPVPKHALSHKKIGLLSTTSSASVALSVR